MDREQIVKGYEYAKAAFAEFGVDVDQAIARIDRIPISMHCWQGDDVIGFEGSGALTGGIQTTGNYPGRARTADELRKDAEFAMRCIPGETKFNLHASYAEKGGKDVDRDRYTIEQFRAWADWAREQGIGLDFNPTFFSHPMMDGDFSLASLDENKRRFWIEHGKRCREIALEFAKRTGKPCAVNYWMPDGFKDTCADTKLYRDVMKASLDEIFADDIDPELVP
ncbi:MAG: L-rhamnose isomerase, partial [Clostridiales bacterium]|nr:L-rhamnose isomerase [Clostridiales bacterium]